LDDTGSVITMTSDERVQIYVPSPQTTPYNTLTGRADLANAAAAAATAASLEMVRISINKEEEKEPVSLSDIKFVDESSTE